MKKLLLGILLAVSGVLFVAMDARAEDTVVGHWAYFMKVYKGEEIPETPEDTLRLRYELKPDGASRLYWWHEGERDHCQRTGKYKIEDSILVDQTEWVDPANTQLCSQDPDMQPGKVTRTPFKFTDGNLVIRLQLGEEELFYVWRRIKEEEQH